MIWWEGGGFGEGIGECVRGGAGGRGGDVGVGYFTGGGCGTFCGGEGDFTAFGMGVCGWGVIFAGAWNGLGGAGATGWFGHVGGIGWRLSEIEGGSVYCEDRGERMRRL